MRSDSSRNRPIDASIRMITNAATSDVFQKLARNIASRFYLCDRFKRAYPLWRGRRDLSTFVVIVFDAGRFFHHFSLQGRKLLQIPTNHIAHSLEFPVDHGSFTFLSV